MVCALNDSGDTDGVLPITSTRYSVDALKLPVIGPWRAWYDDGQVKPLSRTSCAHNSLSAGLVFNICFQVRTFSSGILKLYLIGFMLLFSPAIIC